MRPNFRSTVFQRMFWSAFFAAGIALIAAELLLSLDSRRIWPVLMLAALTSAMASLLVAFCVSRPVDRRIAQMREFAEGLLDVPDGPVGVGVMY